MKSPRTRVARRTMVCVVLTMLVTTPLLSLWSTTLLPMGSDPNQAVSLLGGQAAGPILETGVAISGALLLIFACNTALIGCYHVFLALSRMRFFPPSLQRTNRWRGTPHVAISVAALVPVAIVFVVDASPTLLGDLYAFGLLGAFSVTCIGLDLLRWRDLSLPARERAALKTSVSMFALGVATSVAVVFAWGTNLVAKPLATFYGSGLIAVGLVVAFLTLRSHARQGQYPIFPYLHRPGHPTVHLRPGRDLEKARVAAMLPHNPDKVTEVVRRALKRAGTDPLVFVFRGADAPARSPRLLEILDPYADDPAAQAAFQRAEAVARKAGVRARYVYIPAGADEDFEDRMRQRLTPERVVTE
jgi:hypothetical protein